MKRGLVVTEVVRFSVGVTLTLAAALSTAGLHRELVALVRDDRLSERTFDAVSRFILRSLLSKRPSRSAEALDEARAGIDAVIDELRALAQEA